MNLRAFFTTNASQEVTAGYLNDSVSTTLGLVDSFARNSSYKEHTYVEVWEKMKPVMDILFLIALILLMISVGYEVKKEELLYHIKKPIGVGIGMFSQFVILPLSAFILLHCIPVSGVHATGVLLMSCCPGGALSNILAYFCDGDISLSVTMTSFSTLLAMALMPLNLWMYGRSFDTGIMIVPYTKLALTLVTITSPVALGMLLRMKISRIITVFIKVSAVMVLLFSTSYIIFQLLILPTMIDTITGKLYAVMISLPFIGCALSYTLVLLFRQNTAVRKTVVIECGAQNIPIALAIIVLSFPLEYQRSLMPIAHLYGFIMLIGGAIFCCCYQVHKRCCSQRTVNKEFSVKGTNGKTKTNMCQDVSRDEQKLQQLHPGMVNADLDVPESKTHL